MVLSKHSTRQMVGVDNSEEMLAIARRKLHSYANVSVLFGCASALPFPDQSFDAIISAMALVPPDGNIRLKLLSHKDFSHFEAKSSKSRDQKGFRAFSHSAEPVPSAIAFHYFDDPVAALAEVQRVLKSNGKVVILDWCKDFLLCRACDIALQWVDPAHQQ
jgi:ubiquinone/menaquinone biosynthesis C-methylase UbiE